MITTKSFLILSLPYRSTNPLRSQEHKDERVGAASVGPFFMSRASPLICKITGKEKIGKLPEKWPKYRCDYVKGMDNLTGKSNLSQNY